MSVAITVAYLLSKDWHVALAIGMVEPCVQTVAFFFHERFWHNIESKRTNLHKAVLSSGSPISSILDKILKHKH